MYSLIYLSRQVELRSRLKPVLAILKLRNLAKFCDEFDEADPARTGARSSWTWRKCSRPA